MAARLLRLRPPGGNFPGYLWHGRGVCIGRLKGIPEALAGRPFSTHLAAAPRVHSCFESPTQSVWARRFSSKRFKIYTKTGDAGTSALFSGERRAKDDQVFDALGSTDELSSFIGMAREHSLDAGNGLQPTLEQVQGRLQELGSHIATPRDASGGGKLARTTFPNQYTTDLEHEIDRMDAVLPPLTTFILASGGKASASLHCCRSVARRAERAVVPLFLGGAIDKEAYTFINRLSDYFFAAARYAAQHEGNPEVVYTPERK